MVGPILRPLKNGDGRAADESGHRLAPIMLLSVACNASPAGEHRAQRWFGDLSVLVGGIRVNRTSGRQHYAHAAAPA
jgi:hypothetical protein